MNIADIWGEKEHILFIIQIALFIVQVLSLFFLVLYVWKTWQMASSTKESAKASEKMIEEMKEARDQESAPYVVPFININKHMMFFGIKNIGKSVAKDIKIRVKPELMSSIFGDKIHDLPLIKNGLSSLPPGHELETMFDVSHIYLNRDDFPMSYLVKISYEGGLKKELRDYEQVLDLSVYKDLIPDEDMNLKDVVKSVEDLSNYDKKISEELQKLEENVARGIWIKNPDISISYAQLDYASWKLIAASKLRELKVILERMTSKSPYFYSFDIKNRIDSIIGQILVIASNYPLEADSKIGEDLNSFAFNVLEFSRSMSFLFDRRSEGFNKELSKYILNIDDLLKILI
ncbi:Uncharacterised protein [uncultured archaeon]|nr:Uncharacterised protein [uncultured archaeon]